MESSKVYSICQMEDGFIWLGTDIGLSRFDGLQFKNYTIKNNLGKGGVRELFRDVNNVLWIGHEGGQISRYFNNHFEVIEVPGISNNITSFCQVNEQEIWVTTLGNGVFKIENTNAPLDLLKVVPVTSKNVSNVVFNSYMSKKQGVFLITDVDIQFYDIDKAEFKRYNPRNLDTYFQFSVLFEDSKGNMWYGTFNGGLYKQDALSGEVQYYDIKDGLASNWITGIIEDRNSNIWISHWDMGSRGGVTKISPDGSLKVFDKENGLHDNKIWCLAEDIEGNILIGTTEHGLDIFKGERFVSFTSKNGLADNHINSVLQLTGGDFWIGTNKGISYGNVEKGNLNKYNQDNNQISNQIRFFKRDLNNNIWIGTEDQGVELYDVRKKRFVSQPYVNQHLPRFSKAVWAMEIDKNNILWMGTPAGLCAYDITSKKYVKTYGRIDSLPANEIKSLFCDHKGTLWVGTQNGGVSFFNDGYFRNIDLPDKITPNSITENSLGHLIVGTEAHGVYVLDGNRVVSQYTISDGLYTNNSRFVITDGFDNIYVGTTIGLNKILHGKDVVLSYSERNGFVGIEAKANACFKDNVGRLWFGTVGGLTCYDPSIDQSAPEIPITHITAFMVNGEEIDVNRKKVFPSYKNNILFHYSSISVYDPSSVTYHIMLEGADEDWESTDQQRTANYRALPPGSYEFKVMAFNSHGLSAKEPVSVGFIILAPLYKRPWFIMLMVVFIIGVTVVVVRLRERNLKRDKKLLAEKVAERTKELNNAKIKLEDRNNDIMDSIRYARRIQSAITQIDIPFDDTFVFFKPKDVVSGDFYWASTHNGKEYLSAIDCTGHGVPGAFMSVIGYTSLSKIIVEKGIMKPAEILDQLNREIILRLNQREEEEVNDGMDLSLISYDSATRIMEYAGAYNAVWIVRLGELIEIKANRFAIGRTTGVDKVFTNHEVQLEKGDMVYLFSDGYADQFGGPKGKKYKASALKKLMVKISSLPVDEQKELLSLELDEWKGELEQIDDILIIGRRF
ncbi:two-component regulator propeller domain-containing protein [Plebeiibacterium marinum]|uniref:SpoIIE family protein phosphatase n=1 Tax=Plebeiibacterium marinum TaxID=2992111 RepID=A0AAE3MDS0_9BACT|nr:two-component regulator propeller domain-containing protein [Plebeiobacterium marinum]MCW3805157.1 SpoIIE family protein phosphatase [Plebeiobacterium marinum]